MKKLLNIINSSLNYRMQTGKIQIFECGDAHTRIQQQKLCFVIKISVSIHHSFKLNASRNIPLFDGANAKPVFRRPIARAVTT